MCEGAFCAFCWPGSCLCLVAGSAVFWARKMLVQSLSLGLRFSFLSSGKPKPTVWKGFELGESLISLLIQGGPSAAPSVVFYFQLIQRTGIQFAVSVYWGLGVLLFFVCFRWLKRPGHVLSSPCPVPWVKTSTPTEGEWSLLSGDAMGKTAEGSCSSPKTSMLLS